MNYKYNEVLTPETPDRRLARIACILTRLHLHYRWKHVYQDATIGIGKHILAVHSTHTSVVQSMAKVTPLCSDNNKDINSWAAQLSTLGDKVQYMKTAIDKYHREAVGTVVFPITIRDTYNMLKTLIAGSRKVCWKYHLSDTYDPRRYYGLSVVTDPIVLEDTEGETYNLGPMEIVYRIGITADDNYDTEIEIGIVPVEPYYSVNMGYFHPHVNGGRLCTGDGTAALTAAIRRSDIFTVFEVVESILKEYNPDSPYLKLEEWDSESTCHHCGYEVDPDETCCCSYCDDGPLCNECVYFCEVCDRDVCTTCAEGDFTCDCGTWVCGRCADNRAWYCPECGESYCPGCRDDLERCVLCGEPCCKKCSETCIGCGETICPECLVDVARCNTCGGLLCDNCGTECDACGSIACSNHIHECTECCCDVCDQCVVRCTRCSSPMCPNCAGDMEPGADGNSVVCTACAEDTECEDDPNDPDDPDDPSRKLITGYIERLVDNEQEEQEQEQEGTGTEDRTGTYRSKAGELIHFGDGAGAGDTES